ncbi:type II toxin-antitoxin system RelE/ParE family toxin [Yunchengibacter salinarum]|uniref:type II toxin-antitoxin system RelE/ParE family toxin n=1 Tax=Yunchengibacter salinarum TaxID=3133399 RepID=UPI0035B5CBAC
MKIWKLKSFARDARREGVEERALELAARDVAAGHYEARLSASIAKKRVARKGAGKRGGFRTIVAFENRQRSLIIFLEIYAKSSKSNVTKKEIAAFETVAKSLLNATSDQIRTLIDTGAIIEKVLDNE